MKTNLFDEKPCTTCDQSVVLLSLKGVTPAKHQKAAFTALNIYLDAVAQLCQIKMTEGHNAVFLTGPIANAVKRFLADNAQEALTYFEAQTTPPSDQILDALLTQKVMTISNSAAKSMGKISQFKIVTDIDLPNNTVGGLLFSQSQPVPGIPYLYRLPV